MHTYLKLCPLAVSMSTPLFESSRTHYLTSAAVAVKVVLRQFKVLRKWAALSKYLLLL
jgi:hypothetical protein